MEILQIAPGRLKVTLSAGEMKDYRIDCDKMDYDSEESKRAFEGILAVVRAKTGLDADGGRLYVQFYPSRDGGCELFLIHKKSEPEEAFQERERNARALIPMERRDGYLCVFQDQKSAFSFLELLKGKKTLFYRMFYDGEGDRYLFYCKRTDGASCLLLEEHGSKADGRTLLYLKEHYLCL